MKLLRRVFAFPLLIILFCGLAYGGAHLMHAVKPSLLDYQKTIIVSGEARKIYLVNLGWHSDIVVRLSDIPFSVLPEKKYFSDNEYLAIGWGDAAFYPATEMPPEFILKTLFSPTETVMHLAGFVGTPKETFAFTNVTALHVSKVGFDKMLQQISDTIVRDNARAAAPLREGLYGKSYFFAGNGSYHALNNCNHWTARMLASADIPFNEMSALSAQSVMWQAKKYGSEE